MAYSMLGIRKEWFKYRYSKERCTNTQLVLFLSGNTNRANIGVLWALWSVVSFSFKDFYHQ